MRAPACLAILAALASGAQAHGEARERDTEHIFGFTEGTDIGARAEKEIESTFTGRFGKAGHYTGIENETAFRYGVTDSLRASVGILSAFHGIGGVPGLDDRNAVALSGLSTEFRWRLLDRDKAPFGLAISVSPQWQRIDEISGEPVQTLALPVTLLADWALIPEKLFAAVNVTYAPSFTRAGGTWQQENPLEMSAALAYAVTPTVFLGFEVRQLMTNDEGLFSGRALFVGPSLFMQLSDTFSLKTAWSVQLPDSAHLDLVNFERHQVRLLLVKNLQP
jgi:hypothetical protein